MVARAGPCGAGNACTLRTVAPSSSGKHSAQPSRSARFDAQEGYDDPPSIRNARLLWFPFHLSGALMKRWFSFSPTQTRMYRTRFPGQWVALRGAAEGLFEPSGTGVEWAAMAVLLDQPLGV